MAWETNPGETPGLYTESRSFEKLSQCAGKFEAVPAGTRRPFRILVPVDPSGFFGRKSRPHSRPCLAAPKPILEKGDAKGG